LEAFFASKLKITQADTAIATSFPFHVLSETEMFIKHVALVWTRLFLNVVGGDIHRNIFVTDVGDEMFLGLGAPK
jgi:hypothetical protein